MKRRGFIKALFAAGISVADAASYSSFIVPTEFFNKRFGMNIPLSPGWEIATFHDRSGQCYVSDTAEEIIKEGWSREETRKALLANPEIEFVLAQTPSGTKYRPGELMENCTVAGIDLQRAVLEYNHDLEEGEEEFSKSEITDRIRYEPELFFEGYLPSIYPNLEIEVEDADTFNDGAICITYVDYECFPSSDGRYSEGILGRIYGLTSHNCFVIFDYARPGSAKSKSSSINQIVSRSQFLEN